MTTSGTEAEHQQLASIRRVEAEVVALAVKRKLISFGQYYGRPAWFVMSSRNAQARRLDGEPWDKGQKALTLPGSTASWPVGIEEAPQGAAILFCEGGGDAVAAHYFRLLDHTRKALDAYKLTFEKGEPDAAKVAYEEAVKESPSATIHVVCMLGASQKIHADALHLFKGSPDSDISSRGRTRQEGREGLGGTTKGSRSHRRYFS